MYAPLRSQFLVCCGLAAMLAGCSAGSVEGPAQPEPLKWDCLDGAPVDHPVTVEPQGLPIPVLDYWTGAALPGARLCAAGWRGRPMGPAERYVADERGVVRIMPTSEPTYLWADGNVPNLVAGPDLSAGGRRYEGQAILLLQEDSPPPPGPAVTGSALVPAPSLHPGVSSLLTRATAGPGNVEASDRLAPAPPCSSVAADATRRVRFRLVDGQGVPVSGAWIQLASEDEDSCHPLQTTGALSSPQGLLTTAVPAQPLRVRAAGLGHAPGPERVLDISSEELELRLGPRRPSPEDLQNAGWVPRAAEGGRAVVVSGGPASRAGLESRDQLLSIGGAVPPSRTWDRVDLLAGGGGEQLDVWVRTPGQPARRVRLQFAASQR